LKLQATFICYDHQKAKKKKKKKELLVPATPLPVAAGTRLAGPTVATPLRPVLLPHELGSPDTATSCLSSRFAVRSGGQACDMQWEFINTPVYPLVLLFVLRDLWIRSPMSRVMV
jgi:hypothetical protein